MYLMQYKHVNDKASRKEGINITELKVINKGLFYPILKRLVYLKGYKLLPFQRTLGMNLQIANFIYAISMHTGDEIRAPHNGKLTWITWEPELHL